MDKSQINIIPNICPGQLAIFWHPVYVSRADDILPFLPNISSLLSRYEICRE